MTLSCEQTSWNDNDVPKWVLQMIHIGYTWEKDRHPWKRRVCFISIPCKTVAAPLLALGALRTDLERQNANNIDGHFDVLKRARDSYLENNDTSEPYLRDRNNNKWKFFNGENEINKFDVIDATYRPIIRRRGQQINNPNMQCRSSITKDNARHWRLEGYPVIETEQITNELNRNDYLLIPNCDGEIEDNNLSCSYNGLLLVGDGEGLHTNYMQEIYNVNFCKDDLSVSLGQLLTLHAENNSVKRISFCNEKKVSQQKDDYKLIVADGSIAFLNSLEHFKNCDVIGLFSRDEPIDNLVLLSNKLQEIKRYYKDIDIYLPFENMHPFINKYLIERNQ